MDINNICQKYNYNAELASLLSKIYSEFINVFGPDKEKIIYAALDNTPIVLGENVYDCLRARNLLEDGPNYLVNKGDLKRASGVCHIYPTIKYEEENQEFVITKIDSIVVISAHNISSQYVKGTIIHELLHLIKSYYNACLLKKDILIVRSGLIESKYQLSYQNKKVVRTLISEEGVGLEEGFTSILEILIAKKIVSLDYEEKGYGIIRAIAQNFWSISEMSENLFQAQILGDIQNFICYFEKKFGENTYNELKEISDEIYKLYLEMFSYAFDYDKMLSKKLEIKNIKNTKWNLYIQKIKNYNDLKKEVEKNARNSRG